MSKGIPNLQSKYQKEVIPKMKEKFGYPNSMAVPKINKAVINVGFGRQVAGEASSEERKKIQNFILQDLALIAGQKLVLTKAKKSIAAFKIREGMAIGAMCTLRKRKMYDFLERLISIGLPRSRDFKGIEEKSIDKSGNLTIGLREHIVFPEVSPERARQIFGFEVIVATNAKNKDEGLELLKLMGFPIKNKELK
ncbi:MAG: 50S ribosomal protein L5 [Candidatus Nealsonbacteria bacterium]|nr:50S ribosomal protein L5 [Candidatus Nealsonbacteria bacterium]